MPGLDKLHALIEKNKNSLEVKQETLRNVVTGLLYQVMSEENVSKSDLAGRIGVSKAAVTMFLSGDRNFTLDKLCEVSHHLNRTPRITFDYVTDFYKPYANMIFDAEEFIVEDTADFSLGKTIHKETYRHLKIECKENSPALSKSLVPGGTYVCQ